MPKKLEISKLKEKWKEITTKLKDVDRDQNLYKSSLDKELKFGLSDATFTVSGDAFVTLFNAKDDKDPANVIGVEKTLDNNSFDLQPAIAYSPENCWLKYSTSVRIKGSAEKTWKELGFKFEGEAGLELHSYRTHLPDDQIGLAMIRDVASAQFILDADDIRKMKIGDALALKARGKISLSMSLKWSDVLASSMSLLGGTLNKGEVFSIDVDASAFANLSVAVEDDYTLVVSKVNETEIRVGVVKSDKKNTAASFGATISAKLNDPELAVEFINKEVTDFFGYPITKINELVEKTDIDQLNEKEKEIINKVASKLGIDDVSTKLSELKEKLAEFKKTTKSELITATKSEYTNDLIEKVLSGLLDSPIDKLEELADRTDIDTLSESELKIVEKAAARLGLTDFNVKLSELKEKLKKFRTDVISNLKKAAESKAEVGFKYEYNRLQSKQQLIQALVPVDKIGDFHSDLIKGRLDLFIGYLRKNELGIERFLSQKTDIIESAFGFSLGFGSWSALSQDFKKTTFVERENLHGNTQASLIGARGYKAKWGGDEWESYLDFDASMDEFSITTEPTANEFDFALNLALSRKEDRVTEDVLHKMIDSAAVWNIIPAGNISSLNRRMLDKYNGLIDVTFRHSITINNEAFSSLLPLLATIDNNRFSKSLAAALPWRDGFNDARMTPLIRIYLYAQTMNYYLNDDDVDLNALAFHLSKSTHMKHYSNSLRQREKNWRNNRVFTAVGNIALNPDLAKDWRNFCEGMNMLNTAIIHRKSYKEIAKSFDLFNVLGKHSFHVRALGHFLTSLAINNQNINLGFNSSLSISYTKDGKDHVESISLS